MDELTELLRRLDEGQLGDPLPVLAFIAGQGVELPADTRNDALRRAMLLQAAGGDPHRELGIDDRAVRSLAADLHTDERRRALSARIDELAVLARDLPRVRDAALFLASDGEFAWRLYALATLADYLGD